MPEVGSILPSRIAAASSSPTARRCPGLSRCTCGDWGGQRPAAAASCSSQSATWRRPSWPWRSPGVGGSPPPPTSRPAAGATTRSAGTSSEGQPAARPPAASGRRRNASGQARGGQLAIGARRPAGPQRPHIGHVRAGARAASERGRPGAGKDLGYKFRIQCTERQIVQLMFGKVLFV